MSLAKELIRLAKENDADLVKFQLYEHAKIYKDHPEIPNVELSRQQAQELFDYGTRMGIEVFFSVFDVERVKWCEAMGVKRYKVAHSQRNNILLRNALVGKQIIVSTHDVYWLEAKNLFCLPQYPLAISDLSFAVGKSVFNGDYEGFSDHTIGLDASKIALARGAEIIEKHFAIDHQTGVDAPWSMIPEELKELKRWESVCKQVL